MAATAKTLTTPADPSLAVAAGVARLLGDGVAPGEVAQVVHGTTLVANALIERTGATTCLVTTRGHRDALAIRREHRYDLYDLFLELPEPLVPRRRRWEVDERVLADGTVDRPLDGAAAQRLARRARREGVAAVAVCLLHAYRHPEHERLVGEILAAELPGVPVSLSSDVVPEVGEYVRASTTAANAYVRPLVDRYLETLEFPTGTSDWRTTLEPVRDQSGRIVRLLGRARQVASVDATREELSEGEFHRALDLFPIGMALLDARGVILFVNKTWKAFGDRHGGLKRPIGRKYVDVCASAASSGLPDGREVAAKLRRLVSGEPDHFGHPYPWGDRHFVLRATRFVLNGQLRISMAHQDVTDLASARALAARLADDLLQAQEEERARIALSLHDSTGQHLTAIGLSLASLKRKGAPSPIVDDILHSLSEAQREIRALAYLLFPPKLSGEGLVETLRSFTEGYRRRSTLSLTTNTRGPLDDLPTEVQLAVLRVVQEALGNAHRHAGARRVAIDVVLEKAGLHLTVVDDGKAPPNPGESVATGVGIRGMQARFAQLGGKLTVTHGPSGTVVDGFLPR